MLEPVGESAYDYLLPRSIAYRPVLNAERTGPRSLMPLVEVLRDGAESKEAGWHRNAERAARGLPAVENISNHMEPWEKQLVCLLYLTHLFWVLILIWRLLQWQRNLFEKVLLIGCFPRFILRLWWKSSC